MNDHERSDGVHDLDRAVVCASLNNNHVDVEDNDDKDPRKMEVERSL